MTLDRLLEKLEKKENINYKKILFESSEVQVDWAWDKISILKSSLGKTPPPPPPGGGEPPEGPSGPPEIDIDPPEDGGDGDSSGGSSKNKKSDEEIKIGAIVQDHKTGQKGRIISIDGSKVEIEPMTDQQIKAQGYSFLKTTNKQGISVAKKDSVEIDPRSLNRFDWGDI